MIESTPSASTPSVSAPPPPLPLPSLTVRPKAGSLDGDPMVRWLILYASFGLVLGIALGVVFRRPLVPPPRGSRLVTVYATFRAWPTGWSGGGDNRLASTSGERD